MNKIVIFNLNFEPINVVNGIGDDYTYDLFSVSEGSIKHLNGATSPFIIVKEDVSITSITKRDVISFLLECKIEKLLKEREAKIGKGFYSEVTNYFYKFSVIDQGNFTQQLALLLIDNENNAIAWRTDKGAIVHTRNEFIAVCKDGEKHKRKWMGLSWIVESDLIANVKEYEQLFEIKSFEEELERLNIKPDDIKGEMFE